MKKRFLVLTLILVSLLFVAGCNKKESEPKRNYGLEFKEEYEALNGKVNKNGKEHRTISISEDNPYIKVTPSEIVKMLENKETFYLYVGDPLCPWCRSVLEKSIEVAKKNNIDKIYYIEIWDEEGNEILRDKYELQNNKPVKVIDGTPEYTKLLEAFDSVLEDYNLTNSKGKSVSTGEKRIYAPNYFYVEKGVVKKMTDAYSEKQKDSREELTKEMLDDEEEKFSELFSNVCTSEGC